MSPDLHHYKLLKRIEANPAIQQRDMANAFVHRDYASGSGSIGIALYDDRLEIISPGELHFGLTPEKLLQPHESKPWNPLIASTFYRRGHIETWGRGTLKIAELLKAAGLESSTVVSEAETVMVTFWIPAKHEASRLESRLESRLAARVLLILENGVSGKANLAENLGHKMASGELHKQIKRLLEHKLIEMTIPEKPNSRLQKYRLTEAGMKVLKACDE